MGGKSSGSQTVTQKQELPASITQGLNFLVSEAQNAYNTAGVPGQNGIVPASGGTYSPMYAPSGGKANGSLGGNYTPNVSGGLARNSLVPDLSQDTLQGMGILRNQFVDNAGVNQLNRTVNGDYLNSNPYAGSSDFSGVTDAITRAATMGVSDRFSQAGRSGGPGEGMALGSAIAQQLAPYAFQAQQSALDRGSQYYDSERARQQAAISGAIGLPGQEAQGYLTSGSILEELQRQQGLEPFTRLQLASGPIGTAISGAPSTTTTTQPINRSSAGGALGGALAGGQLGSMFGLPGLGAIGGGLLGLFG